jgi:hypothetical protein
VSRGEPEEPASASHKNHQEQQRQRAQEGRVLYFCGGLLVIVGQHSFGVSIQGLLCHWLESARCSKYVARMDFKKELQARAGDLTDVTIKPSKFGVPIAFWRGKKEFAHFQRNGKLDIRLTKARIKLLKPDYRLTISFPPRDWVLVHIEEEADVDFAMKLMEGAWKAHK